MWLGKTTLVFHSAGAVHSVFMARTSYRASKTKHDQKIQFVPEVEKGILPLSSKMENMQTTVCGREKEQGKPRLRRWGKSRNTLSRGVVSVTNVQATASVPTEVSSWKTRDLTLRPVAPVRSTGEVCCPCSVSLGEDNSGEVQIPSMSFRRYGKWQCQANRGGGRSLTGSLRHWAKQMKLSLDSETTAHDEHRFGISAKQPGEGLGMGR